jgi:hypothetical protein
MPLAGHFDMSLGKEVDYICSKLQRKEPRTHICMNTYSRSPSLNIDDSNLSEDAQLQRELEIPKLIWRFTHACHPVALVCRSGSGKEG